MDTDKESHRNAPPTSHGWLRTTLFVVMLLLIAFIVYKYIANQSDGITTSAWAQLGGGRAKGAVQSAVAAATTAVTRMSPPPSTAASLGSDRALAHQLFQSYVNALKQ